MRRRLAYLVVWTLATGMTMGASWLGLRSVLDAATPRRVTPLSATDLRRSPSPAGVSPLPSPTRKPPAAVPTSMRPGPATRPPATSPSPSGGPAPRPSSTPVGTLGWVEVPDGRGGTTFQRTFHLSGGDATIVVNRWECRLISNRPQPGYTLVFTRYDLRSILVSFLSSGRASRVMVTWRNHPYAEVTESVA